MTRLSITLLIKFLVGLLLVQAVTAIQVVAALETGDKRTWVLFALLALTVSVFAALLFTSIASHGKQDALHRARESFFKEREQIRVKAEREKSKLREDSHQRVAKATSRAANKANFKVSAAFLGTAAVGAVMLLTQFFTLGLMVMTTAGGALGGYLMRLKQDHRQRQGEAKLPRPEKEIKQLNR